MLQEADTQTVMPTIDPAAYQAVVRKPHSPVRRAENRTSQFLEVQHSSSLHRGPHAAAPTNLTASHSALSQHARDAGTQGLEPCASTTYPAGSNTCMHGDEKWADVACRLAQRTVTPRS